MEYVCKVGTASGEILEQTFTAADELALRSELEQKGYYLFSIRRGLRLEELRFRRKRVATTLLLIFGQELAALLKAGLPLLQSLDVMLERQKDPVFRSSLASIRERVKSGVAISEAFKTEGDLYPPILSASLVAGERSGSLEIVLRRFVQYLRLTQALKKKAISVSVYPIVLFTVMITLVFVMLVYVIPQFESFYEGMNAQLPTPTRILMAASSMIRENLLWIVVGVAAGVMSLTVWLRRPGSAARVDALLLRLPYVGRLMRMYATSQLARTLSTLLAGGLPLLNALDVAGNSIGNRAMAAAVSAATPQIREGKSLTAALESTGMLENLTLEMVKVGEQTGALGDMLGSVAEFYDEEVDTSLAAVLALVEPAMLVMMAFLVAGMLLAFYLPLFQAISAIQSGPR
jgi:type IV pilus assembly protein PilC